MSIKLIYMMVNKINLPNLRLFNSWIFSTCNTSYRGGDKMQYSIHVTHELYNLI